MALKCDCLLTDTDIVRKGVGAKRNLDQTTVEILMTTTRPSIPLTRTSHEAYEMMGDLGVRHLVICDRDKIVGLGAMRDLLLRFKSFEPSSGGINADPYKPPQKPPSCIIVDYLNGTSEPIEFHSDTASEILGWTHEVQWP